MHAIQIRHFILMTKATFKPIKMIRMDNYMSRTTFSLIYISGPNKCTVSHVYISPLSELLVLKTPLFKYFPRLFLAPENGKMLHSPFSKLNCSPRLLSAPGKGEMLHPPFSESMSFSWLLTAPGKKTLFICGLWPHPTSENGDD